MGLTIKDLKQQYEESKKESEINVIGLFISMPGGEIETIINSNIEDKIAYLEKTYSEDLVHSNCDKIKIIGYGFAKDPYELTSLMANSDDTIELSPEHIDDNCSDYGVLVVTDEVEFVNGYPVLLK